MATAKATVIVALVGALALLASVANALTWTSPTPQFNTYDATSTISGPFVAQSGDQTYADVQVFASYALGAPCSGTKECSACVGSGTGPIDYSCPCTIDFAANVTSNDGCAITGYVTVPGNGSEPVASYSFGWAVKAAPIVTTFAANDGKAYADLSGSSDQLFRIEGTDLLSAAEQVEVSIAAINPTTQAPCATINVGAITMVSRSALTVNVGPRSALASTDGCVFVLQSFKRFNFTATLTGVSNITATLTPTVTDNSASAAAAVTTAGDAIAFTVTGSNLPTSTEQASDFYAASLTACGSVTVGTVTCTSRTATSATCEAPVSGGDAQNCVLSVAPKRWGVAFSAVPIAKVVDVRLSANSGYFTMSGSSVTVTVKTLALFNPSTEHYWFEWVLTDPVTGESCGSYLTNGTSNGASTGCQSASFNNDNIACTIPANLAGNGCFLRAQLHRRDAVSDLSDVGFVGYSGSMAATTQYFDLSKVYQNLTFTFGAAGIGGGFRKIAQIQYNITGTGCSGNVGLDVPTVVCSGYHDVSYSNGMTTVVCEIDMSVFTMATDGFCEIRASIVDVAARYGSAQVGYIVQAPPTIDAVAVNSLGFTGSSKLVSLSGINLPLTGETYSVEYISSPSGCFSPAVAGLCAADGLGIDFTAMDCLISGTFTDIDICNISMKINRLGAVSDATTSNSALIAVRMRQAPQVLPVAQRAYVLFEADVSFTFRATGLPDITTEGASRVSAQITLDCASSTFTCSAVSLAATSNTSVTTVTCVYSPGVVMDPTYDSCAASVSVKRYGVASPAVSIITLFGRPEINASPTKIYPLSAQNYPIVIEGKYLPREGEVFSGYMQPQGFTEQQSLVNCVRTTPGTSAVTSLSCQVNISFTCPTGTPFYFFITRMGILGTNLGYQGYLSSTPLPFTPVPLPGVLVSPSVPFFLNFTGFYMNTVSSTALGVSTSSTSCARSSSSSTLTWASCAAGTVISTNEVDCNVVSITDANPRSAIAGYNQIDGCALYAQLDASTTWYPIGVFVNQPVLTASAPAFVRASASSFSLSITGAGLPPGLAVTYPEVLHWIVTSDSVQCDMSLVKFSSSTNAGTTSASADFTASELLDNCAFNVSVVRSGFASNSIPYGRFVARTQPIASASTGFALPASYVTFSANYPPVDGDTFDVDFATVCGGVDSGFSPVTCTVQGSIFNCSVSYTATENDCTVQASVNRASVGYGKVETVGVLISRPTLTDNTQLEVVAAADTLVRITGSFLPVAADASKSIALTASGSGAQCAGSVACTNAAWSSSEVNCTVNAPLALRGCQVSAVITRFGIQSAPSVQFAVVEPPFTPFTAKFLFETEISPPSDLFPKMIQGFEVALNVSGGISVALDSSKRAVQATYIGVITFSTYDSVAAGNQLRADQAAQQAFLNSIFLYTTGQASAVAGSSMAFDGAAIQLPPTAPPTTEAAPVETAPQAQQGVTGGLDAGGIAAIVVVCGIAFIVAVVLIILALVGVICKPDVPSKSANSAVVPAAQSGGAASAAAPAGDKAGAADSSSEEESSEEEEGEEEEEDSESAKMAASAPAAAAQVPAAPAAEPEQDEEEDEESSESSSSDEESSEVEESDE